MRGPASAMRRYKPRRQADSRLCTEACTAVDDRRRARARRHARMQAVRAELARGRDHSRRGVADREFGRGRAIAEDGCTRGWASAAGASNIAQARRVGCTRKHDGDSDRDATLRQTRHNSHLTAKRGQFRRLREGARLIAPRGTPRDRLSRAPSGRCGSACHRNRRRRPEWPRIRCGNTAL